MNDGLGVIFDMDGVLVDSYRAHLRSWQLIAGRFGLRITEEQFAPTFGRTSREIIRQLWPDTLDDAQIAAFDQQKEAAYRDILREHFPAMPGVDGLLRSLSDAGYLMAIGSSGPPENVDLARQLLPGGNLIAQAVTGREVTRGKPDPEVFLIAAGKLGIPPARCAVVEDAPVGLEAARRAGMAAIGLTGTRPREELAPNADRVVDALGEITPEIIAGLIRGRRSSDPA